VDLRKVRGEVNPADLYTKHIGTRERISALVQLSGCQYRGGRATAAPLTRTTETNKKTIAEFGCNSLEDADWEWPSMPHIEHKAEELDRLYPSMIAPEDLDSSAQEEQDAEDRVYQTGRRIATEIAQTAADVGRRRCQ